jgi:hypothetical protein
MTSCPRIKGARRAFRWVAGKGVKAKPLNFREHQDGGNDILRSTTPGSQNSLSQNRGRRVCPVRHLVVHGGLHARE